MGIFPILQKGILRLFQSWVWCTTPRATCVLFSQCPFSPPPPFALFQPTPAPTPKKKDPCFPAKCFRFQPNPTNQGLGPGISGTEPHRRPPACRLRCTCPSCSSCEEIMWMPSQNWTVWKFDVFSGGLILVREFLSSKRSWIANDHLLFCCEVGEMCIFSLQCHSWFWLQINIHPRPSDLLWKWQKNFIIAHGKAWTLRVTLTALET